MDLGTRVVRGADWKWENQDGGEGCAGTVVQLGQGDEKSPSKEQLVWVQWDCGTKANYRAGIDGKHDLLVLDSANEGVRHVNVTCDGCGQEPIIGLRWHCLGCPNFDLCTTCYMTDCHILHHPFERIDESQGKRTTVGTRQGSIKLEVRGIFKGAKVVRGEDWKYKDQDGGSGIEGQVTEITGWDDESKSKKDAARVSWERGRNGNIYRVGKQGKVDLKCTVPAVGGSYYRDHLPHLTFEIKKTKSGFTAGDKVYVHVTIERLKQLCADHGGWNENMKKFIGKVGVVHDFTSSGDVMVEYPDRRWRYNPEAITKVPALKRGDEVLIKSDRSLVEKLQQGHGGWNEAMDPILGRTGKVLQVDNDGDLVVSVEGNKWVLNPAAVTHITEPQPRGDLGSSEASGENSLQGAGLFSSLLSDLLHLQSTDENGQSSKDLADACKRNQLSRVREILDAHPLKIDEISGGHTALQVACHVGHCDVIKLLLDRGAHPEAMDVQGFTAMHHAAYANRNGEALQLLLERGLNPNSRSVENGSTPLHLAVKMSNIVAVRILSQLPGCDVNVQDEAGDTPLFDAITEQKNIMVDLIMAHPRLSMTVTNRRGFNYLHHAVLKGNTHAVEELLARAGEVLDVPKSDGFTCLHIAAINNHSVEAKLLLRQPGCSINVTTTKKHTPLHLAASEGYSTMVELLLDHGADVNAEDEDGDTALHIALAKESMLSSGQSETHSLQVLFGLTIRRRDNQSYTTISRCLLNYGANVHHLNGRGETPMDRCSGTGVESIVRDISVSGGTRAKQSPTFGAASTSQNEPNKLTTMPTESSLAGAREGNVAQEARVTNDLDEFSGGSANNANTKEEFPNMESALNGRSQGTKIVNILQETSEDIKENIVLEVTNQELSTYEIDDDYKNVDEENQETPKTKQLPESTEDRDGSQDEFPKIYQSTSCDTPPSKEEIENTMEVVDDPATRESKRQPGVELREACTVNEKHESEVPLTCEEGDQKEDLIEAQDQDVGSALDVQNDGKQCLICEENEADVVFKPCGHRDVCVECSSRMKRCLKCNAAIAARGRKDGEPISGLNDKSMTVRYQLLEGKARKMEESIVCCICAERKKNIIFLCGHGTCQRCAKQLNVCPICQKRICKKVTIF